MGNKPGPVPNRSDQVRRRNAPEVPIDTAPAAENVEVPEADKSWHPIAAQWYRSLAESGQSHWYEPSDWALAYLIAESMSRDLKPQVVGVSIDGKAVKATIPLRGASMAAYLKAMTSLLVTEGDRRRLRIELSKPQVDEDEAAAVADLDEYRTRFAN